jgi:hypothetical protein
MPDSFLGFFEAFGQNLTELRRFKKTFVPILCVIKVASFFLVLLGSGNRPTVDQLRFLCDS